MANGYWRLSNQNTKFNETDGRYHVQPPADFLEKVINDVFPVGEVIKKPILIDFDKIKIADSNDVFHDADIFPQYIIIEPVINTGIIISYKGTMYVTINNTSYEVEFDLYPVVEDHLPAFSFSFTGASPN